ncbi:MAG: hypothetical protein D6781_11040 [Verrucomicrobia bacterium]|nr:MAG: hypothetical protein D6781_11040 [Verrucomicrobiota bacterium]
MDNPGASRCETEAFLHVVRRERGRARYFVVHPQAPRYVVEMDAVRDAQGRSRGVIRRVCVPNSATGDYHLSAKHISKAMAFFEATGHLRPAEEP